jgi:hypothetical protein
MKLKAHTVLLAAVLLAGCSSPQTGSVTCSLDISPQVLPGLAVSDIRMNLHNHTKEALRLPYAPAVVIGDNIQTILVGPGWKIRVRDEVGREMPVGWVMNYAKGLAPMKIKSIPPGESWELSIKRFPLRDMKPGKYTVTLECDIKPGKYTVTRGESDYWSGRVVSIPLKIEIKNK